jgi:hypothetical protein
MPDLRYKKVNEMSAKERFFAAFEQMMDEDKIYIDPRVDFRKICYMAGTRPEVLDRILSRELGMKGSEILSVYRSQYQDMLLKKYGCML